MSWKGTPLYEVMRELAMHYGAIPPRREDVVHRASREVLRNHASISGEDARTGCMAALLLMGKKGYAQPYQDTCWGITEKGFDLWRCVRQTGVPPQHRLSGRLGP